MVALLIDTATERGVVALLDRDKLLFLAELPMGLQNSQTLMPTVQAVLTQGGLRTDQLSLFIAGIGPGSYTGMRVGAVVAKTLSFATNKPLAGVSTLHGLVPTQDGTFAALIDAKIGGLYALFGEQVDGVVTYHADPQLGTLEELGDQINAVHFCITPRAHKLRQTIPTKGEWVERAPDAVQMGKLAWEKFAKGEISRDGSLDVLYLRKTQAEIEKGL